ncbi:ABC transporter ATP-binding protein [Candidatus Kuenenia sp.]|uniref:ABC transporter ATP-binding protein n=1 Tax=Candidatus Kuenenia sp. TaxID=2499824 RepID=UPI0032208E19
MNDIAIRVEGLSKKFHIGRRQGKHKTLRETLTDAFVSPIRRAGKLLRGQAAGAAELDETIWALKDISFEVKRGEAVGIIGRNGSGKSTLLKILSRITEPSKGFAEIHGRVGSLLEVGTGFHQELTGRENIYLNGAILGMKRAEIDRNFNEIVAFSEVEKFIDTPVKHYSSGMYLRLAFAVAAHLEPEILLVDEVLAVGDLEFQKKCLGKMQDIAGEGRTIFFVSHNMSAINRLCSRTVWVDAGQVRHIGLTPDVIESYLSSQIKDCVGEVKLPISDINSKLQMKFVRILSKDDKPVAMVDFQKSFRIEIGYEISAPLKGISVLCRITDLQGNIICTSWDTDTTDWKERVREPVPYLSICTVPGCLLRPGRYLLTVGVFTDKHSLVSNNIFVTHENILSFEVSSTNYFLNLTRMGIITPLFGWEVIRNEQCTD